MGISKVMFAHVGLLVHALSILNFDGLYCFNLIFSSASSQQSLLARTITFLSFQIGQLCLVYGCMTIRRCVAYHSDLYETLTFDLKVK